MGKISFIGGGNMATSLVGGLVAHGHGANDIAVADPDCARRKFLATEYGVSVTAHNLEAVDGAETVVLAVKPQVLRLAANEIGPVLAQNRPLVISVAAGVGEPAIRRWLGYQASIIRTMPNTPALVSCGATALYANPQVSVEQHALADAILGAVGITVWVERETLLDAVTALSGSGPAYCFLLLELMIRSGEKLGLESDMARQLALQTMYGAAKMARNSDVDPSVLRQRVTSPGGTTERALQIFSDARLESLVDAAMTGARDRATELGRTLGSD